MRGICGFWGNLHEAELAELAELAVLDELEQKESGMARPKDYRELIVWQKAMALARRAYTVTVDLPRKESYGLVAQTRRAAVSIPSNLAEGHGRLSDLQFRHFLGNARGSLRELLTQMELAGDPGYIETQVVRILMEQGSEVARLINGLIASLNHSGAQTSFANSASSAGKELY